MSVINDNYRQCALSNVANKLSLRYRYLEVTSDNDGDEVMVPYVALMGYDLSQDANRIIDVAPAVNGFMKVTETQLTAPGLTALHDITDYAFLTAYITVASIDTNVIVALVQAIDSTDTTPAESTLVSTAVTGAAYGSNRVTITANGDYIIQARREAQFGGLDFISEAGGTAATLDVTIIGGR